ncbi:MAG: nucleotidyltransferase domain-containing protein [Chloroflexota bacterium]|nr:MAG: nucleotidyltransferase domain-containing protein [Chloroflexota bacterium]
MHYEMLPQDELINRLEQVCREDERLLAAMHYGSLARGEGDVYSDLDIMLFFADEAAAEIDQRAWLSQISTVELFYVNEFGNSVAIFDNLVRGEFHFDPAGEMAKLAEYGDRVRYPALETTVLVDKNGRLAEHLAALIGPPLIHESAGEARYLGDSFLNWFLFGFNMLSRGEYARALEIMALIHDNLLRMARIEEGRTGRWISPTKALEKDISPAAYRRFQDCTAALDRAALQIAYQAGWDWGNEMLVDLGRRYELDLPAGLIVKIGERLDRYAVDPGALKAV